MSSEVSSGSGVPLHCHGRLAGVTVGFPLYVPFCFHHWVAPFRLGVSTYTFLKGRGPPGNRTANLRPKSHLVDDA